MQSTVDGLVLLVNINIGQVYGLENAKQAAFSADCPREASGNAMPSWEGGRPLVGS